ncbi:hypothetical protein [Butyrivibrio sp. WCD2001]|uniref:hypothetical protein n=1 Tax=Butyrivibrio sp. WCD2001 TaxID=1280681 RepID=UPI00041832EA|nr:hypothetical protein [Butyrivibrio sp. WCD2001]
MSNEYFKPLIIIIALIILCSLLARTMSGGETLAEYANKHPDQAYGTSTEIVSDGNAD